MQVLFFQGWERDKMTLEKKSQDDKIDKELKVEIELELMEIGIEMGDITFHKRFNPFKKNRKGYNSPYYGDDEDKWAYP